MKGSRFFSSSDFEKSAKRNLPKFVFDFIEGGAGDEQAALSNVSSFSKLKLIPHVRHDSGSTELSSNVLGLDYAAPFGVAPLGLCGLVHPDAEIILAKAAAKYKIPYVISAASNQSIQSITNAAGTPPWFQLYIPKAASLLDGLLNKAADSNCPVLIVTVDTAIPGRRLRDLRNGLKLPYKLNFANMMDAMKHPQWLIKRLLAGTINFPNFEDVVNEAPNLTFRELMSLQTGGDLNWDVIQRIRALWNGKLVLKGILSPADAIQAQSVGVDAVIISNHGGRQLGCAPATISMLPFFIKAGLKKEFLMLDSGIRSGDSIISSLASGASFTFLGRACLYALAARGEKGIEHLLDIIFDELNVGLTLLGVRAPSEVNEMHCHRDV